MTFLNSLTIIKINAQFPMDLDFCTFKGLIFSASFSSWKGMHSNKNMRNYHFSDSNQSWKRKIPHPVFIRPYFTSLAVIIIRIKLSAAADNSVHSALPTAFEVGSGGLGQDRWNQVCRNLGELPTPLTTCPFPEHFQGCQTNIFHWKTFPTQYFCPA